MPNWLLPWLMPIGAVLAIVLLSISTVVGFAFLAILGALSAAALVSARIQYLRSHPPDPELVRKPFWKI
jgi:hypothetical protein